MKKYLNYAYFYAIFAMIAGVFYREFTKWNGFTGVTVLGKVHTHLFLLGMIMFLIVALFSKDNNLEKQKSFRVFMFIYNIGLPLMTVMMIVRGSLEVLGVKLLKSLNAGISGVSGIGHILVGIGIIFLFIAFKNSEGSKAKNEK